MLANGTKFSEKKSSDYFGSACYPSARGGAFGLGIALRAGRSRVRFPMVSLEFFFDIIPPALGLTQPLTEMSTRNISWGGGGGGVKAAGA